MCIHDHPSLILTLLALAGEKRNRFWPLCVVAGVDLTYL